MSLLQWLLNGTGPISDTWESLGIDILWQWLPQDIQSWITVFIVILFVLAIKRAIAH